MGEYEISAAKAGFQSAQAKVNLVVGQRASIDLVLTVAELRQSVQVQETAISADVTNTDTSGLGRRAAGEGPAAQRPQLRPIADAESRAW